MKTYVASCQHLVLVHVSYQSRPLRPPTDVQPAGQTMINDGPFTNEAFARASYEGCQAALQAASLLVGTVRPRAHEA
eukprot:scaffold74439_cov32-Tisochrysis_lutea.AAC.3